MLIPLADGASVVYFIASSAIVFGVLTISAAARFRDTHVIDATLDRHAAYIERA